ncbi:MAG: B12-binding domain-containing radical SAM protein [Candidatus Aegiribacteria sp.]|nr:B12-binding domain-containing radical SAM protein [Candidatus Aegiribacteria sp.]
MRITAVNPPFLPDYSRGQRSPAVTKSGTLYYPIWLAYAAGALEQSGNELDLIDAPADGLDIAKTAIRIDEFNPSLVIVETSTPSIESDVRFADSLCKPGRTVMLVGTHPSALPEETLQLGSRFDGIVVGEYEIPLVKLAQAIEVSGNPAEIPGLFLRGPKGEGYSTGHSERLDDLDSLPFVSTVYAKHLNIKNYNNPNALYPQVMIMGGRGCPYECTFCVFPQVLQGRKFRYRSIDNIIREMLWVQDNLPDARAVFFEDDTISVDKKRLRELAEAMIRADVSISWTSNIRANVDYETLSICRRAGLRSVCVGFESGSDEMLRNMKKGITTEMSRAFMRNAAKAGVLVHGCFMVGTRGETGKTMEETLEFALEINPDTAQFYPMMVYPGTEAYRQADESGNLTATEWRDWLTEDGLHNCVVSTDELTSEQLVDFCDHARRKFYLRPLYIFRKMRACLLDADERKRTFRAFSTFRKYILRNSRKK